MRSPLVVENINEKVIQRLKGILDEFEEDNLEKNFTKYPEALQRFYTPIHNLSKSPRLIRIIQSMYDLTHVFRLLYFINPENVRCSLKFHRELINAFEKRDGELAEKLRKKMLQSSYEYLLEVV